MSDTARTIAVIGGTGAAGYGIALRLARARYDVIIGTRDAAKGERAVAEIAAALGTSAQIRWGDRKHAADLADVVMLTVPYSAQSATVRDILDELSGKVLIDATVPLVPPKVGRVQLPVGGSAVAALQAELGSRVRVVSALQNVAAAKLRDLTTDPDCDVLVCADDAAARALTIELLETMGMRGIDAGPIANSAAAEALTSVLITINRRYKVAAAGIRITGLPDADG